MTKEWVKHYMHVLNLSLQVYRIIHTGSHDRRPVFVWTSLDQFKAILVWSCHQWQKDLTWPGWWGGWESNKVNMGTVVRQSLIAYLLSNQTKKWLMYKHCMYMYNKVCQDLTHPHYMAFYLVLLYYSVLFNMNWSNKHSKNIHMY